MIPYPTLNAVCPSGNGSTRVIPRLELALQGVHPYRSPEAPFTSGLRRVPLYNQH